MKQSPSILALTILLTLTMLILTLCPGVAAAHTHTTVRQSDSASMPTRHVRVGIRMEDGVVTDDDGIIGNGTHGADRAPVGHRSAHRRHRMPTAAGTAAKTAVVTSPDGMLPERDGTQPRDGALGQAIGDLAKGLTDPMRGRTLPDEGIANDDIAEGGTEGDANGNAEGGNNSGNNSGDMVEDGTIEDGHAEDGTVDDSGADKGATEDGNSSARSLIPWVIGILVVLAAVLVILALIPRRRSR